MLLLGIVLSVVRVCVFVVCIYVGFVCIYVCLFARGYKCVSVYKG